MCSVKKKKNTTSRVILSLVAVILVVGVIGWLIISGKLGLINRIGNENRIDPSQETFDPGENNGGEAINANDVDLNNDDIKTFTADDVKNILMIGYDGDSINTRGRSDTMIICSVNTKTKDIKLTSLMRDMYVQIPGYSKNRLNAAYIFGGMSLLDEVIEKNFGVKIDGNIAVNFDSFLEAMTAVGNLDIELTKQEATHLNSDEAYRQLKWNLAEGVNSLTPEQVLAYSRIRKVGQGDFDRTERQRKVIIAAFNKVKKLPLTEILSLADKVLPCFATDMNNGTILGYITKVGGGNYSIGDTLRVPVDGAWKYAMIDGTRSVVLPDLQKNSEAIKEFIYGQTAQDAAGKQ
ncbi:MAG: LCP family protein [Firmicutes bacterium]|nr:LCP family protein [Bacillota bacterium]